MANETKIVITAATAQAESAMRSLGQSVDGVSKHMFNLSGMAGTLGGALTITAFAGFIKSTIDAADNLNDLAQKTGIGIEALAGYKLAAEQSGTSLESVAKGVKGLSAYMIDHADKLKKLGVTATDSNGAMVQLADVFTRLPDGVEKSKLAVDVFGKAGLDMIPMLNLGSQGLADAQEKAAEYGRRMKELAPDADKFNDQLAELSLQASIVGINLAALVTGPMAQWLEANNEGIRIAGSSTEALRLFVFNLDAMTSEKPVEEIKRLTKALEDYQAASSLGKFMQSPTGFTFGGREDDLKKQIAFLEFLKKQEERTGQPAKTPHAQTPQQAADEIKKQRAFAAEVREILGDDKKPKKAKEPDAEVKKFIASLQEEAAVVGLSTEAHKLYDAAKMAAANPKFADAIAKEANLFFDRNAAVQQGVDAQKALEKANKDLEDSNAALTRSALEAQAIIFDIDPIAKASAEWEKLTALKEQGLLTDDQIGKSYAKTFADIDKSGNDAFKSLEDAVRGWGSQFTNEMTKMVRTGKMDFKSLANSIIDDLLRIQIQKNITEPLLKSGTGFMGDIFGKIFGGGSSSAPTGMAGFSAAQLAGPIMSANGNVFSGPGISAYSGSVVDKPTLFPFARGTGLMGEAGPEAILPLTRINGKLGIQAQGGGNAAPNVVVNVVNQSGKNVNARQQGGPQFDGRDWVIGVVLEAADNNPHFRNAMGMA